MLGRVLQWNNTFPVDLWWRSRHNIAFGSDQHLDSSFPDQLFEYVEESLMKGVDTKDEYIPGSGDIFKKKIKTQDEIDKEFDDIDLSEYDDGHNT